MRTRGSRRGAFKIVQFRYPSGSPGFKVVGTTVDGKRVQEKYTDQSRAGGRLQELTCESTNTKLATALRPTRLTDVELQEAEAAFGRLRGTPHSLTFAVEFLFGNYRPPTSQITVQNAFDEFLETKRRANRRQDTLRNLEYRIGLLTKNHGSKYVAEITDTEVEAIINAPDITPRTQLNRRLALGNFMRWCMKRKYSSSNPVAEVEAAKVDHKRPKVLSVADVKRLLDAARTFKKGKLLPRTVLCLFAGLRPTEAARITWDDIDLAGKMIRVEGEHSKVRAIRTVDLTGNACDWLRPLKADKRAILTKKNFRKDLDAMREKAGFVTPKRLRHLMKKGVDAKGFKLWTPDVMRHTALSAHLAVHQNEGKTALWGGTSPGVVHKYYKGLLTKKQAKEFWGIKPPKEKENVIQFPAKASLSQ